MSQGSNYKKEVMEALSNAPTNLISNKAFLWAASNLPDNGGKGSYSTKKDIPYNHDADDLFKAIGISSNDQDDVIEEIKKIYVSTVKEQSADGEISCKKSVIIEKIMACNNENVIKFFLAFGVMKHHEELTKKAVHELAENGDFKGGVVKSIESIEDLPEDAPKELKEILKALINLKKRLKGDFDEEDTK